MIVMIFNYGHRFIVSLIREVNRCIVTINAIFCVLGVIGNSLVLIAVYRTMELHTLSNFYLVALAVADFLTSAIVQPLLIVMVIQESQ